jgi:prepilin-type N-terminal cleavage/methylation domain-containing protein
VLRRLPGRWGDELGFTLIEMTIVITLMGLLLAIATTTWFGAIESRRVDSATNQVVADLRLANTSASNRLVPWRAVFTAGSPSYQLVKQSAAPVTTTGWLPEGTEIGTTITVEFAADGSASKIPLESPPPPSYTILVRSTDGSPQQNSVDLNTQTSRATIAP